jgi:DNA polymerase-3 subunit delta
VILLLYGGNELAIRRRLQELKDQADGGSGMLLTNLNEIDGREAKPQEILGAAMSPPFLAPARLVIVDHLLARAESRGFERGPRSIGGGDQVAAGLEHGVPESTILVFLGMPFRAGGRGMVVTKGNPLVKQLGKLPGAIDEEHPAITKPDEIQRYIRDEAAARGVRFRAGRVAESAYEAHEERPAETDPVALLANLLQGDTLAIANELDKLALYSMGADVTVAEVNRVCAGGRQANRFTFVDAVQDGNLGVALEMLERLRRDGEADAGLLASLFEGYRRSATILELIEQGANDDEIGKSMGRAGSFRNLRDQAKLRARRVGAGRLRAAYEAMVAADRTHKMGEVDEDVALEILLARLAGMATAGAR